MNMVNFDGMYKLLFDYKHEINKNIPDKLKCLECKNILINACQVPCGCRYCCGCVNKMLENGFVHCPGNTDDCKQEYLSNNQLDFRANKAISKLIVKCPEETCSHECELIKMKEHLRICGKKSMKCPFADLGCDNRKMESEILNEHCQSSNFNHCKILIEMIDNIRNEIDSLKIKDGNNEITIENLEKELKIKSEEMKLVKLENENLKQQFESLKENMENRFEEISEKMKNENLQIIESIISKQLIDMKMEKDEKIKQEYEKMKENLERKIEEIQKENQSRIESINDETKSIKGITAEGNVNEPSDCRGKFGNALIKWTIDKLDEIKKINNCIESDYFTSTIKQYKMRLTFWANGRNDFQGKGCSIFLRIYSDGNDDFLPWPFRGDVTIGIANKTDPNFNKTITKYCEIEKPSINSCISSLYSTPPARYDYAYLELIEDEVMVENCFIVECFVDFK